ncbi:hypothetical protein ACFPIJ_22270 [Dactylosporangium cerinum]|uniref:Transposase IS111A/IS1328/IS1533 N-terminal domain-containing protein n=1 Tax=Dactylosporangium cerinum TaxID=1434730 RepID=A0ABV9VXU8_9ACTN
MGATIHAAARQLLTWAHSFGILNRAGVEGTGSYGAALTRFLRRHHIAVIEVNRPDRAAHRRHGKTRRRVFGAASRRGRSQCVQSHRIAALKFEFVYIRRWWPRRWSRAVSTPRLAGE